jgi:cysteinylglycine-S-conjugate dipeptidase
MDDAPLRQRIADDMPRTVAELERLVRIPSMGYPDYDPGPVRASAEATRDVLRDAGVEDARLLELAGGHPAVFGEIPGPEGSPTVLLYAHHDVQPEGPVDRWDTAPFEPVVKDGRLYGRGAADDKSGIVIHAAAIRALLADGGVPVTVKLLVEGEEECTAENLPQLVEGNADLLRADVAVIADGGNYRTGTPTLNTSIRGVTDVIVQVRVLPTAQHSGSYGGPIPDAITALARMIASLHDDAGDVAIEGLKRFPWEGAPVPEHEFRAESGCLDSIELAGSGSLADRLFTSPAVAVLGIDAPAIAGSSNQIVPVARARISRMPARKPSRRTSGTTRRGASRSRSTPTPAAPGTVTSSTRRPRRAAPPSTRSPARTVATRSRWGPAARSRWCRCSRARSPGSRS